MGWIVEMKDSMARCHALGLPVCGSWVNCRGTAREKSPICIRFKSTAFLNRCESGSMQHALVALLTFNQKKGYSEVIKKWLPPVPIRKNRLERQPC
jgi:hypothetical protein